jgi:hypothetical protein
MNSINFAEPIERNINFLAKAENTLRRYLTKYGRGRESFLFHFCCKPNYAVKREEFLALVRKLVEEKVVEVVEGVRHDSIWIVRKDLVESTIAVEVASRSCAELARDLST